MKNLKELLEWNYLKWRLRAARKGRELWREFSENNDGMGTVEIILIIVVLVGLVIIFKTQITSIVNSIFSRISSQADKV